MKPSRVTDASMTPPSFLWHFNCRLQNNNYTKWFIIRAGCVPVRTSLLVRRLDLCVGRSDPACSLKYFISPFWVFHPRGCRNSQSPTSLAAWLLPFWAPDSWAMAFFSYRGEAIIEKRDGCRCTAAICESEWFGECCIRGRGGGGGRGLCGSQTASRGELLTPHRCGKAPRWPFTEARLLMRKTGDYPSVRKM